MENRLLYCAIIKAIFLSIIVTCEAAPCSDEGRLLFNSTNCLLAVRNAAKDKSKFWFGESYPKNCLNKSEFDSECFNPFSNYRDSLMSRIFRRRALDEQKVKSVLKVTYNTHTGSYEACGNGYEIYKTRTVTINPLVEDPSLTPFELISRPDVSWEINSPTRPIFYTLAVVDAGYVSVQALYVNIPRNKLDDEGQTVVAYEPPLNPTSNANPYVFLLFSQTSSLELPPQWLHELSLRKMERFEDFLSEYQLEGPIGISWFTLKADPYSADRQSNSPGHMNTCAQFVNKAFKLKRIPYIPKNTPDLNVYLDLTFKSPAFQFTSCCSKYSYQAVTYKPNPITDGEAKAALMRADTTRNFVFHKSTAFPLRSRDFKGELHTLITVDPDATPGSSARPYVHMLVTNIREGDFKTGHAILPYMGPWPPDPHHHTYYFLLFKQQRRFQPRIEDYAFMNCSGVFRGRCGFNMAAMVKDGDLELVGASWQLVKMTPYVRSVYASLGFDESVLCAEIEGYTPNCTSSNDGNGSSGLISSMFLDNNLLIFLAFIILLFYFNGVLI